MNFKAEVFDKYLRETNQLEPNWISMNDEYDTMFIKLFDEKGILHLIMFNNTPFVRVSVLVADRVDVNTEGLLDMLNKYSAEHPTYSYCVTEDNELFGIFNFCIEDADFNIPFFFMYKAYNVDQMLLEMIEILNFLDRQIPEGWEKANNELHKNSDSAAEKQGSEVVDE